LSHADPDRRAGRAEGDRRSDLDAHALADAEPDPGARSPEAALHRPAVRPGTHADADAVADADRDADADRNAARIADAGYERDAIGHAVSVTRERR